MSEHPLYDRIGRAYGAMRHTDPRWEAAVHQALGSARTVLNLGAGTGSYEPSDRTLVAVDPSLMMLGQRPEGAAPATAATAEALPFADASFDAVMAILTVHHWRDWRRGLSETKRVARDRIVILTADVFSEELSFWLLDYFPDIHVLDQKTMPPMDVLMAELPGARVEKLLVPHDCRDGFCGAYWRRPDSYLDHGVRDGISGFKRIDPEAVTRGVTALAHDLESGEWNRRYGDLRARDEIDIGYRLVIAG